MVGTSQAGGTSSISQKTVCLGLVHNLKIVLHKWTPGQIYPSDVVVEKRHIVIAINFGLNLFLKLDLRAGDTNCIQKRASESM